MEPWTVVIVLVAVATAFTVSAAAGFGGSLILVPALALLLGTKAGVPLAALLLAGNNVVKVIAYRHSLPVRRAVPVVLLIAIGAFVGARVFVATPESIVTIAVIVTFLVAFLLESFDLSRFRRVSMPVLALASGTTSGFSGTSGPLKGLAVRSLDLDRLHLVGALSIASLVGDVTKTAVWTEAALLGPTDYLTGLVCVPLMFAATFLGRRLNTAVGERGFTTLFWAVMVGYTGRLVAGL